MNTHNDEIPELAKATGISKSTLGGGQSNYSTLQDDIASQGYGSPVVIPDGQIHRFTHPDDKPGSKNCWVVSHGTAGAYGSWKLGTSFTWSDGKSSNNAALLKQIREYQRHREADRKIIQQDTADEANVMWVSASDQIQHPYPLLKRITPYGIRQSDRALLIPMYFSGRLVNLQRIYPDGGKFFMKGGRVTGCYCPIGTVTDHVYICEGYATGCSLHEHTSSPVMIAFNCGNLKPAALAVRKMYPTIKIIIAGDNDVNTKGNPGMTKALAAAAVVHGCVFSPDFSDEEFDGSDWNDYLTQGGKL